MLSDLEFLRVIVNSWSFNLTCKSTFGDSESERHMVIVGCRVRLYCWRAEWLNSANDPTQIAFTSWEWMHSSILISCTTKTLLVSTSKLTCC
jgi:hypothetical protein